MTRAQFLELIKVYRPVIFEMVLRWKRYKGHPVLILEEEASK